jgi:hypothetical protein
MNRLFGTHVTTVYRDVRTLFELRKLHAIALSWENSMVRFSPSSIGLRHILYFYLFISKVLEWGFGVLGF